MSVFSDNITSENAPLQAFYNRIKKWVYETFPSVWEQYRGDLSVISSVYNSELNTGKCQSIFAGYNMYHIWLHCQFVANPEAVTSTVLVNIFYSNDPTIYVHKDAETFMTLRIPFCDLQYEHIH
jgi:hypothetical protein